MHDGSATAPHGEGNLQSAIARIVRTGQGWSAVALHLSRLSPPDGVRPHHRRIGRAVLQDAARRSDGQVFDLRNGDVVLLARDGSPPTSPLAQRLQHLFGREASDPGEVVSEWRLPTGGTALLAYAADRGGESEVAAIEEAATPPATMVDVVAAAIAAVQPQNLLHRQTAVVLDAAGGGARMRASYQELSVSLAVLESRIDVAARPSHDAALLLHLGRHLDARLLHILQDARGSVTPLDIAAAPGPALHLNLSLPAILSAAFIDLLAQGGGSGRMLGVEVAFVEAVADPAGFARAAARLKQHGVRLVLDGVSYLALLLTDPTALGADLLKLHWSPRMADLPDEERRALAQAVAAADPARLILHRADSEAAVRWGQAQRIRLFQGRHIDQMLAVQRMLGCPDAPACTLRQCAERAVATGGAGRSSCTNLALLDAALPAR